MEVPKQLLQAIQRVKRETAGHGAASALAADLLPLLEAAAERVRGSVRKSARGTGEIEYVVEKTQQGEVLTERRLSGKSEPFRCPRVVYEAIVGVLAEADRPLTTEEITSAVEKRLGTRPPDHQVRVPLRLWMHIQPPLLMRSRARYHRMAVADYSNDMTKQWEKLKS